MSSYEDVDLRKSLKYLYDDLLDAENNQKQDPSGFKNKIQVLYENLQDLEMKICAVFGLGDFGVLNNFEPEYLRRGDSGMDQMIKSQIKLLAVEIGLDLEQSKLTPDETIVRINISPTQGYAGDTIVLEAWVSKPDTAVHLNIIDENGKRRMNTGQVVFINPFKHVLTLSKHNLEPGKYTAVFYTTNNQENTSGTFEFLTSEEKLETIPENISENKSVSLINDKQWDFFICHASENKEAVARPLYNELEKNNLHCWLDEFSLIWGDSLMKKINYGLSNSSYGIVIFSKEFFEKNWANKELEALFNLAWSGENKILPLRYNLSQEEINQRYPLLSGIVSRSWTTELPQIIEDAKTLVSRKRSMKIVEPVVEKSTDAVVNTTMNVEVSDEKVWISGVVNPNDSILENGPSLQTIKPDGSGGVISAISNAFEWDGSNYKTFVWLSNFRDVKDESIFKLWSGNGSKGTILIKKTAFVSS